MIRLYRVALWLLPPAFRRAYGHALLEEARSRLAEAGPGWPRLAAGLLLAGDLAATVAREWWDTALQRSRGMGGGGTVTDLRCAFRTLRRSPGFTLAVILTLGLGIGAGTVALGLVDAWLLTSMPYPGGDRLVVVWPEENWSRQMTDLARDGFPSLEGLAGVGGAMLVLQEGGEPEELFATEATTNLFDVLRVRPALGRGFLPADGEPGAEPVTILSHHVWTERFASDPGVVGRTIALGGEGHLRRTVVGVMPPDHLPVQGDGVDAWVPVVVDPTASEYGDSYFMQTVGRLAPGAGREQVASELRAFGRRLQEVNPGWFSDGRIGRTTVLSLTRERTGDRRTPLLAALGAALLILLVACANVANLVVARTTGRERELSVRAALGAGGLRNARTVLAEVALLATAGATAGLAAAVGLVRLLERRVPAALPDWGLAVDLRWAGAAAALAVVAAVTAGLVPGLQAARRDPARALAGGRGSSGGNRSARLQELLSAIQLGVATASVAAMALLGRSLVQLGRVDPGIDPSGALTFRVTAPPAAYPADADVVRFFREARRALEGVAGVEVAGFGSRLPLSGGESRITVDPEGWERQEGDPAPVAWHRLVTPGYLEALGARLREGRIPGARDDRDDQPEAVVINRAAAQHFWPRESAVGKRFYGREHRVWVTVAGVVDDVLENGQAAPVLPGLYIPHRDWPWRTLYAVVRTREDPATLLPALKEAVWSVAPGTPISRVATLDRVVDRGLRATRMLTVLAAVAASVTLLLGALGIYGVVSHAVARRVREIGVRAALGADRGRLLRGELAGATRIVAPGTAVGLFAAWIVGRALGSTLYDVPALDVPSFGVAVVLLAAVAYLAALVPARRASTVDPARVIRNE